MRTMSPVEVLMGLGLLVTAFLVVTGFAEYLVWRAKQTRREP
jgi:hypothetical protein